MGGRKKAEGREHGMGKDGGSRAMQTNNVWQHGHTRLWAAARLCGSDVNVL